MVFVQLKEYSDQVIHVSDWHASHALMSEYAMVLHLHRLLLSIPLGPVYEYPGCRESMVNEPPLHVDIKYAATVHAFWPRELKDHFHDKLQSGAATWAAANPEKNNKDVNAARFHIEGSVLGGGE